MLLESFLCSHGNVEEQRDQHRLLHSHVVPGVRRCLSHQPGRWEMSEESRGILDTPLQPASIGKQYCQRASRREFAPHILGRPENPVHVCAVQRPVTPGSRLPAEPRMDVWRQVVLLFPTFLAGEACLLLSLLFSTSTCSSEPRPSANNEKVNGRSRNGKGPCWCRIDG